MHNSAAVTALLNRLITLASPAWAAISRWIPAPSSVADAAHRQPGPVGLCPGSFASAGPRQADICSRHGRMLVQEVAPGLWLHGSSVGFVSCPPACSGAR
ncbi:hypothetical protein Xph01_53810 [Micromonospora phaseoli]|nr:hypothetical protein Xph01_53810 [Micromonospora phaseoli]